MMTISEDLSETDWSVLIAIRDGADTGMAIWEQANLSALAGIFTIEGVEERALSVLARLHALSLDD